VTDYVPRHVSSRLFPYAAGLINYVINIDVRPEHRKSGNSDARLLSERTMTCPSLRNAHMIIPTLTFWLFLLFKSTSTPACKMKNGTTKESLSSYTAIYC
jgi:hypothetical protein